MRTNYEERFRDALARITDYKTVNQLRRDSERQYGLRFEEALEMAYENVIEEAKSALRGYRKPKTTIPAIVLLLLLPSLASAQSQVNLKPAQTAIILGNVADIVSTELALQRGGVHEGNAILSQRMTQRIALKAAGTAAQVWIVGRLGKEHPRLAKVVGYSAGAFFGGVTIHNLRVSR